MNTTRCSIDVPLMFNWINSPTLVANPELNTT
jgi:hypothetical protein